MSNNKRTFLSSLQTYTYFVIALSIVSVLVGVDKSKYIFDLKDLMSSSGAAGSFFGRPLHLPKANLLINKKMNYKATNARAPINRVFSFHI